MRVLLSKEHVTTDSFSRGIQSLLSTAKPPHSERGEKDRRKQ
jgi:hypothetical protein